MTLSSLPIIHGPRSTQRLGKAIVIDLTAPQCNLVVERGSSLPRASVIVTTVARHVIEQSKAGEKIEHLVVVGSSVDPTTHPDFREVSENLRALRDKWFPRAKLCLFSNCRDFDSAELRLTLGYFDKLFFSFEWGTAKTFTQATGEKSSVLATFTRQLASLDHVIVQARFFRGAADNSSESEVKSWIKKLQEVRPREVHILETLPAVQGRDLKPITKTRQKEILEAVAASGFSVAIHEDEPYSWLQQSA